jgi:electron transfer flavoprotein alpha subunit
MSGVLVVVEAKAGAVSRASWEAVAAAQHLGGLTGLPVTAAVVGAETGALATDLATKSLAGVARVEHALLGAYSADGFVLALEQLVKAESAAYVVAPHSYQARDWLPALACRFAQPLIGDVTAIGAGPTFTRGLMQGRLNGEYRATGAGPVFVSVQAGAFRAEQVAAGAAEARIFTPTLEAGQIRTRAGERYRAGEQTVDLGAAQAIVAVGRGIREESNLPMIEALAAALGAEIGASRPICDNGWLGLERQIGSSGQTVAPKLYVAVGISGAIQHVVGMKGSGCVVAINRDPEAPIFETADYGIVGDLFEVVPALTEAVARARE